LPFVRKLLTAQEQREGAYVDFLVLRAKAIARALSVRWDVRRILEFLQSEELQARALPTAIWVDAFAIYRHEADGRGEIGEWRDMARLPWVFS